MENIDDNSPQFIRDQQLLVLEAIVASTSSLESRAMAVASYAHHRQVRKYTFLPYFSHLMEVREIVSSVVGHSPNQRICALLHDIVEDVEYTGVHLEDVRRWFGQDVANIVNSLSAPSKKHDGSRAQRKAIDLAHIMRACPEAQTIKLADIISNVRSILQLDPKFAAIYLPEKKASLDALKFGDKGLWVIANNIILDSMDQLQLNKKNSAALGY